VGKGVAQMLAQLPNAVAKAAYPQIAGLPAQEAAAFTAQMVRQNLMLLVPAACILAAVAPLLLPALYGEAYAASSGPVLFLLGATVLQSVGIVVSRFFNGTNDQRPNILTRLVAVSVNLLLNSIWIPTHGIIGAAAALLVSYSLDAGLIVGVFLVRNRMGLGEFILPRRSDFDPYRQLVAQLRRADASMT
ncbi:MAG: lipopolysaccharide biosynthesis protein, partial [Myxococcota bacterium]